MSRDQIQQAIDMATRPGFGWVVGMEVWLWDGTRSQYEGRVVATLRGLALTSDDGERIEKGTRGGWVEDGTPRSDLAGTTPIPNLDDEATRGCIMALAGRLPDSDAVVAMMEDR